MRPPPDVGAVDRQCHDQRDARQRPGQEQLIDRNLGHQAVQDDRQGRREEEPEAPGAGDQAEREAARVPLLQQHRVQEPAQRHDRHAGSAGERREQRARAKPPDRDAAGQPADEALGQRQHALRCFRFGQHEAREREQRDRDERRQIGQTQHLDDHRGRVDAGAVEEPQRQRSHQREDRRAQNRQSDDQQCNEEGHFVDPSATASARSR
jgi:hypothetical protein